MCEYPIRILPKKQYVKRIDIDNLYAMCQESLLVRRLDCDGIPFHYIGGRKLLNEGVIGDDVLDWSTNLLGGEFKIEDICWRQLGKGIADWNDEDVNICDYDGSYELTNLTNCVFISLCCLHNQIIPYRRKFGSRKDLEQYSEITSEFDKNVMAQWNADNELECHATITVEHKPTMLNYWHMTIEISPKDFDAPIPRDSKKNKSLKKRVKEALHMHILSNVICDVTHIEDIPKTLYVKDMI